jgi:hypothetical protein
MVTINNIKSNIVVRSATIRDLEDIENLYRVSPKIEREVFCAF